MRTVVKRLTAAGAPKKLLCAFYKSNFFCPPRTLVELLKMIMAAATKLRPGPDEITFIVNLALATADMLTRPGDGPELQQLYKLLQSAWHSESDPYRPMGQLSKEILRVSIARAVDALLCRQGRSDLKPYTDMFASALIATMETPEWDIMEGLHQCKQHSTTGLPVDDLDFKRAVESLLHNVTGAIVSLTTDANFTNCTISLISMCEYPQRLDAKLYEFFEYMEIAGPLSRPISALFREKKRWVKTCLSLLFGVKGFPDAPAAIQKAVWDGEMRRDYPPMGNRPPHKPGDGIPIARLFELSSEGHTCLP